MAFDQIKLTVLNGYLQHCFVFKTYHGLSCSSVNNRSTSACDVRSADFVLLFKKHAKMKVTCTCFPG